MRWSNAAFHHQGSTPSGLGAELLGGVVVGVAAGCLVGVDPGWWGVFGGAVGVEVDGPVFLVDFAVVPAAEQDRVAVRGGGGAGGPVLDVVGVGPGWWAVAAWPGATLVAQGDRAADRGGEDPGGGADVEDLGG